MAFNPYLVPKKPRDPGAAAAVVDLDRRVKSLEGRYGLVGANATITAPIIQTADTGAKIQINPFGIFVIDGTGTSQVNVTVNGISILEGTGTVNTLEWQDSGGTIMAQIFGWISGPHTQLSLYSGISGSVGGIEVSNDGLGHMNIFGTIGAVTATLFSYNGDASWPGTVFANTFVTTSDLEHKQDVKDLGDLHQAIHKLRPVSYVARGEEAYGLIAQEVIEHLPGLVKEIEQLPDRVGAPDADGNRPIPDPRPNLGINYTSLVALLLAAVQDLTKRLEKMEGNGRPTNPS